MKIKISIRLYEELNNYLHNNMRKHDILIEAEKGVSVKNIIESLNVPCPDVDLVLVNGQSVNFDYILKDKDLISVYPVFERLNIESVSLINHSPLRKLKFLCDVHLGRLAKNLRMLGFDTLFENNYSIATMIQLSNTQQRILLSRNKKLTESKRLTRRFFIHQDDPVKQLRDVISNFDLKNAISPMTRCLKCNGVVQVILKDEVQSRVDKNIFEINREFTGCQDCKRLFWKGSHYDAMMKQLKKWMD